MLSGTRAEEKGGYGLSVMRWATGHEVVVTLDTQGAQSGDLTSCWDWSCQGKEQGFGTRRKRRDYVCVCLHKQRALLSPLEPFIYSPSLPVCCPPSTVTCLFQQGKLRHCLVLPSFFCICLYSGRTDFILSQCPWWTVTGKKCKTPWKLSLYNRITNTPSLIIYNIL